MLEEAICSAIALIGFSFEVQGLTVSLPEEEIVNLLNSDVVRC